AIIAENGDECEVIEMDIWEYKQALLAKLIEEANEAAQSTSDNALIGELADLVEVIDALLFARRIDYRRVLAQIKEKKLERGGFKKRLKLVWATKRFT